MAKSAEHRFHRGEGIMSKINIGRVVLGGIFAGVIIDIFEFVLNGVVLADQWKSIMAAMNLPVMGMTEIAWFNAMGLVLGIITVWTYAAIRARFGAGVKTAVFAGVLTWLTACVYGNAMSTIIGMFPMSLTLTLAGVGLVELIVATIAGAWLYKE
jgi:hypothetical protein